MIRQTAPMQAFTAPFPVVDGMADGSLLAASRWQLGDPTAAVSRGRAVPI